MTDAPLSFFARFFLAWGAFFRVLFDGALARRVQNAMMALPPAPPAEKEEEAEKEPAPKAPPAPDPEALEAARRDGALALLSLLQREGRLVDFLEQDVAGFSDADIGAAARVVHDGSQKALRAHVTIVPVREEPEDSRVKVAAGFSPDEIKLTGEVKGKAPYEGVLRHRGWRASEVKLPARVGDHDAKVLAPAEVEL